MELYQKKSFGEIMYCNILEGIWIRDYFYRKRLKFGWYHDRL